MHNLKETKVLHHVFYSELGEHMMMNNDASLSRAPRTVFGAFAKSSSHHSFITSLSLCKTWTIYGSIFSPLQAHFHTHLLKMDCDSDLSTFPFRDLYLSFILIDLTGARL